MKPVKAPRRQLRLAWLARPCPRYDRGVRTPGNADVAAVPDQVGGTTPPMYLMVCVVLTISRFADRTPCSLVSYEPAFTACAVVP